MEYTGSVSVRQNSHVDVFAPDWICTSPVLTPSSARSYARCLTRPAPAESTNNNAETTQLHRDENLLKKTSLKLRSRIVKKTADTNSTSAFIPPHQPMPEWKPDVVHFEEAPDVLRRIDCPGNTECFSRDIRVEEGDTSEVFQPAWLRQRETHIKEEGKADVDSADDKISGVKKKKKSKACKAWRMKVHSLKDTDEEEDKVHFAPTWMKKILSKSDDVIATKTTMDCEDGHEFNIRHDGVGTELKTVVVSEHSTKEPIDNIESYERVHRRVDTGTSSKISRPKEDTIGSLKENAQSSAARSVQHNALIGESDGKKDSSFRIDHVVSCVGDTCSWSQVYHPEFGRQIKEFIFQVLLGAVVSLLVEEVTRKSLKENADQGERKESKATKGQDGDCEEHNEQRIDTHTKDALVQGIDSNEDGAVYNTSNNNSTSHTHDVDDGKAAACCGKFTPGLGANRQGEVQLINTNDTMASVTSKPGELMANNSPSSETVSTPHQNFLKDASSLDGSLQAKDDDDSSFESIFGEETLIDECLQEDAIENGYAASVAILEDAEGDGLIADVRLLWMLDEDGDYLDGDEMMDGYRAGGNDAAATAAAASDDDDNDGDDWDGDEEGEVEKEEDVADGIDIDDVEDELMTDAQPLSMDFFNLNDDNSTDEDFQRILKDSIHQTILEAPDCKIKNTADATDITTVRIHYKNLTHISTNPGRVGRRPQIILELDVLTTPGNFERRRLEFYRSVEKPDGGKLPFRKPFKSPLKKPCRKVCETPSSVHRHDEENNMCEVLGEGLNNYHPVTKGTNRKITRINLLRKSKLPKWKKVKKWFR